MDMHQHFQQLARWIALESAAESRRLVERRKRIDAGDAEKSGETLLHMVITDSSPSFGGRHVLTLTKRNRELALPWNRLRVGSPVVLSHQSGQDEEWLGVVSGRTTYELQVAVNEWLDADTLRVDLSPDEITRKRQLAAIGQVQHATGRTDVYQLMQSIPSAATQALDPALR